MAFETTNVGKGKTNVIAGATGYIGKSVVRESVRQGYNTIALVRDEKKVTSPEGQALFGTFFEGANVVQCDVTDPDQLTQVGFWYISFILEEANSIAMSFLVFLISSFCLFCIY